MPPISPGYWTFLGSILPGYWTVLGPILPGYWTFLGPISQGYWTVLGSMSHSWKSSSIIQAESNYEVMVITPVTTNELKNATVVKTCV